MPASETRKARRAAQQEELRLKHELEEEAEALLAADVARRDEEHRLWWERHDRAERAKVQRRHDLCAKFGIPNAESEAAYQVSHVYDGDLRPAAAHKLTSHPHIAWFHDCKHSGDVTKLVQQAFVRSLTGGGFTTACNFDVVLGDLVVWFDTLHENDAAKRNALNDIKIDPPLYRAFAAVLGPKAWRYTSYIDPCWLPTKATFTDMLKLIKKLPEECRCYNGTVVWPIMDLAQHLLEISVQRKGHPRSYVSKPVLDALIDLNRRSLARV